MLRPVLPLAVAVALGCVGTSSTSPPASEWSGPPGSSKPFLTATRRGDLLVTWFEPRGGKRYALRMTRGLGTSWAEPRTILESDSLFVNWADFPSIVETGPDTLVVHWLGKVVGSPYAYHVRIARSTDGGASWSDPITAHTDRSAQEHGFVAMVPNVDGSVSIGWLDGGPMAEPGGAMSARTATLDPSGTMRDETRLDARTCECCQLAMARAGAGLVAVYRDRSPEEVRDIAIVRETAGRWSEPRIVSADNWIWRACPVNGPAIAASGNDVGVAWFTAADSTPRVQIAFSADGGATFGAPVRIDEGNPVGRVHFQLTGPGAGAVAWLETRGESAEWRVRPVGPNGAGRAVTVGATSRARDAGFVRSAMIGPNLYLAWTEPGDKPNEGRVRISRVSPGR